MSRTVIALLLALGAGVWIYNRFMRTTGSLTQRSIVPAAISAVVIFFIAFVVLGMMGL